MSKPIGRAIALTLALMLLFGGRAVGGPLLESAPVEINCAAAVLLERDSGQVIFEENADDKRPVASVVKVMSALLVLEAIAEERLALDDSVVVSENAAGMGGSQVLLDAGETQTVDVLLKSLAVGSANDATVALAEHLAGSVKLFVERMNERAAELGMANTRFVNATGLPAEGQYTTARDVALMARELSRHELYYDYSTIWLDEVVHESGRATSLTNTNRMIRLYDGCDGLKTGSTNEAGYCMAATASRSGMRLIAVVLGASSSSERFKTAGEMLDYGFANYRSYPVAERGALVRGELPVTGGAEKSVKLMLDGDLTLLIEKGEEGAVSLEANLPQSIAAPVEAGERVGSVRVLLSGRVVDEVPVASVDSIEVRDLGAAFSNVLDNWFYK